MLIRARASGAASDAARSTERQPSALRTARPPTAVGGVWVSTRLRVVCLHDVLHRQGEIFSLSSCCVVRSHRSPCGVSAVASRYLVVSSRHTHRLSAARQRPAPRPCPRAARGERGMGCARAGVAARPASPWPTTPTAKTARCSGLVWNSRCSRQVIIMPVEPRWRSRTRSASCARDWSRD